jgi:large subunit ribosomal protein L9
MIEVILKEPVDNLGNRGDVVKVAPGYARNYLLPRKLALAVTEGNKRQIEAERKRASVIEAQERTTADALSSRLAQVEVVVARRVGERDTLYGSVTSADIVEALARQGFEIDRRKLQLPEPLKHLGEFSVSVRLHRDVTTPIKVLVVKEEVAQA